MEQTTLLLGTIISIAMLIIAILGFYFNKSKSDKESSNQQTALSVKLLNIEKELLEVKALVLTSIKDQRTEVKNLEAQIQELKNRIVDIETNCKIIQSRKGSMA